MAAMADGKNIDEGGNEIWLKDGELHREGGPAIVVNAKAMLHPCYGTPMRVLKGTRIWLLNGVLHRDGGPAVEYWDGMSAWWRHGKLHREDGPAVEYTADSFEYRQFGHGYWIGGAKITKAEFEARRLSLAVPEISAAERPPLRPRDLRGL